MHVRSFCLLTFALTSLAALALPPALHAASAEPNAHITAPQMTLVWLTVLLIASGCSGNSERQIITALARREPVCLTIDWGSAPAPIYSGRPAPDTLLLLPERGYRGS